jgi:hypothetical protein
MRFKNSAVGGVGDLYQRRSMFLCNRYPLQTTTHQDWERARTASYRFAREDKELGPQLGKQFLGERPREAV